MSGDDNLKMFFHKAKGVKSLQLHNVNFVDVSKIIFESYPDIQDGNDGVNFGRKSVSFRFKEINDDNVLSRTLNELEIDGITCRDNKPCMVIRGNTTTCPQETISNSTTKAPVDNTTDSETTLTPPSTNNSATTDMSISSGGSSNEATTSSITTTSSESTSSGQHIKHICIPTLFLFLSKFYL